MNASRRSPFFVLLLGCMLASGVACTKPGLSGEEAHSRANREVAREKARMRENLRVMDEYHTTLARSLASNDNVDALLAAASAAERVETTLELAGWESAPLPPELASAALSARAQAMAGDDPATWYALAMRTCGKDETPCAAHAARARLLELDGDNAAAWLLEFDRLAKSNAAAARSALARAARAPAYRDYSDELRHRLLRAQLSDPTAMPCKPDADDVPRLDARGFARFTKMMDADTEYLAPNYLSALSRACDPEGAAKGDAALQDDRRAVGALEASAGAALVTQGHGVLLQWRLARDDAERAAFAEQRREVKWLLDKGSLAPERDVDWSRWIEKEIADRLAGIGDAERARRNVAARGLVMPASDTTQD